MGGVPEWLSNGPKKQGDQQINQLRAAHDRTPHTTQSTECHAKSCSLLVSDVHAPCYCLIHLNITRTFPTFFRFSINPAPRPTRGAHSRSFARTCTHA